MLKKLFVGSVGVVLSLMIVGTDIAYGADFCQTQEIYEQEHLSMFGYLPSQCLEGECGDVDIRDSWIPGPGDPIITLRVYFNVFAEDDGSNPAATPSDIANQVVQFNADLLPYKVQFVYDMRTINSTQYRYLSGSEVDQMKFTYAVDPDLQCNVYVASYGGSFGTFPWDQARPPLSYKGGIVLSENHCYPTMVHVLTHEMGHNIGLWHTHHGVSEVPQCSECYETADGAHADSTGDMCSDTPPTPVSSTCLDHPGTDPCTGLPWGDTAPENYMSYGGDACWAEFTTQQNGRFLCWIDDVLTSWMVMVNPQVVSTDPPQNDLNVSATTDISVTFDMEMDLTTFTNSTFTVNGTSTGLHDGAFSSGDQITVTFNPNDNFDDGEVVTVVLTTDIQSEGGGNLANSYIWSFTINTTNVSPATFYYDDNYDVGEFPFAVYAAMFDGDDDPDLAVPNWMTDDVSILLNNGDATFPAATSYATGNTPSFIYSADFDADGNMDLVTSDQNDGELSVLMGNGDGTFDTNVDYAAGTTTTGVVAVDLNGDGIFDLAAPNHAGDNVAVLIGNGDGTFGTASFFAVEDGSNHINAADLDNDADLDLITTNCSVSSISVLLNNGDGTFAAHVDYPVSLCPMGSYSADLDGDGYLDLATANKNNNTVAVLINNGLGGFAAAVSYGVGSYPMHIFASDLDSDDDLDLVAPNVLSDNVSVLLNNGDGTFASHITYNAGDGPVHVYPSDLDGDGDLDLAIANEYEFYVSVLLNQPLTLPSEPILVSPLNGTIFITFGMRTVTLDWLDVDYAIYYEVLLDNNYDFSSPIANPNNLTTSRWTTPLLGPGKYYWKVRAYNEVGWGNWSETWSFKILLSQISCPVLFSHNDDGFKYENPLLTACENSGYVDVVTDYYHLPTPITDRDGKIVFQLRELEDEITYLYDIELITVDHSANSRVSCDVNGQIDLYQNSAGPLTAVDNYGNNQLEALAQEDGILFVATEPGHLIVTFPHNADESSNLLLTAPRKPPCPEIEQEPDPWAKPLPGQDPYDKGLMVEILDAEGNWVEVSSSMPSRSDPNQEIVLADIASGITGDVITLRLSWLREYSADAVAGILPAGETPTITKWQVDTYEVRQGNSTATDWNGFEYGQPLVLKKGDVFEFGFDPNAMSDRNLTRDYVVRAVGRYQPDYDVFTHLLPVETKLHANYPNPFNPATTISYDLPASSHVRLDIYNVSGQMVATLINGWQEAGRHQCVWNSKDANGHAVSSGVYFYQLKATDFVDSKKMVLLK